MSYSSSLFFLRKDRTHMSAAYGTTVAADIIIIISIIIITTKIVIIIIIIIIMHFIYTLKSKVQTMFSSVHIVRSKYNIIQYK